MGEGKVVQEEGDRRRIEEKEWESTSEKEEAGARESSEATGWLGGSQVKIAPSRLVDR